MQLISKQKCFNGFVHKYSHDSKTLSCEMKFNIYIPSASSRKLPTLFFLSGLTCTEDNFFHKSGVFIALNNLKEDIIVVAPDTSPRGDVPHEDWDLGKGAGFYINATKEPWNKNYKMYEYVTEELFDLVQGLGVDKDRVGVMGHSMGGHGALIVGMKSGKFKSISAFAPICHPSCVPWGMKAFNAMLETKDEWKEYDACELIKNYQGPDILIHQGTEDQYLDQLRPQDLKGHEKVVLKMVEGYDHSYYFISTFIEEHLKWHIQTLKKI